MARLTYDRDKLQAAAAAFWSGGAFLYVPDGVVVEKPFQIAYVIDEAGTAQYAHTLAVGGANSDFRLREYDLAADFEGPALHVGRVRALPGQRRALPARPPPRLGRRGAGGRRHLHPHRARGTRRPLHVDPDPPRRQAHPPAPRAGHGRAGVGHAPPRHLLHRGPRAPRPVHGRLPRGRPHDRGHGVEGRGHGRLSLVLRGPDQDRPRRAGVAHLPPDALDDALPQGQGRRHPVADRRDRQRVGLARRHGGRDRRGDGLLHADARAVAPRRRAPRRRGLLRADRRPARRRAARDAGARAHRARSSPGPRTTSRPTRTRSR